MTIPGQPDASGRRPESPVPPGAPLGARATAAVPPPAASPPAVGTATPRVVGAPEATAAPPAAAPPAAPAAAPAAVPPAGPPIADPDYGGPPAPRRRWRARRHRRLHRLQIGTHAAPVETLDLLQLRRESVGLVVGRGHSGEPVTVRLFRPRPTRVVLIGELWAARLITFRALRFGARAVVLTSAPGGWIDLGRRATSRTDRVAVLAPHAEVTTVASSDTPVLQVEPPGATAGGPLRDWCTKLTILPSVAMTELGIRPDWTGQLASADLVLTQRLAPPAAAGVGSVLSLDQPGRDALPTLPDGMLAAVSGAEVSYAWVNLTSAERQALSQPG